MAMAQEVVELVLEALDLVVWVDMDLVDKNLATRSLLNQVMAHRWVELAIDQVNFFTNAHTVFQYFDNDTIL